MATVLKYNLKQFNDISYSGFHFEIPQDACDVINYLCSRVGSASLNTTVFSKAPPAIIETNSTMSGNTIKNNKKRRGNNGMEVSAEEWDSIRTFQTTKIEQQTGMDGVINEIRLFLNKLTDKTFLDVREKIIDRINLVVESPPEELQKLGEMIYDICSTNKFYSKIFADVFAELAHMYSWLNQVFKTKFKNIKENYINISYVDADKDYDGFCEMNKTNERRRAITTFYMNLALNNFIQKKSVVKLLRNILATVMDMINVPDKKNEVDELTEIVAILFNKDMIEEVDDESDTPEKYYVNGETILDTVNGLAQKKAKDYQSLSNKAIFKYMDLVEM
jgi:hypothetical protein